MKLTKYKESKAELAQAKKEIVDYIGQRFAEEGFVLPVQTHPRFSFIKTTRFALLENWSINDALNPKVQMEVVNLIRVLDASTDLVQTISKIVHYKNIKNTLGLSFFRKVDRRIIKILTEVLDGEGVEIPAAGERRNINPHSRF